jgi:hypothetical protein
LDVERGRDSGLIDYLHEKDARSSLNQVWLRRAWLHFDSALRIDFHDCERVLVEDLLQASDCGGFIGVPDSLVDGVLVALSQRLAEIREGALYLADLLRDRLQGNPRLRCGRRHIQRLNRNPDQRRC